MGMVNFRNNRSTMTDCANMQICTRFPSLCRVERKNKMAPKYNVLADISPGDEFYTSKDT